MAFHVPNQYRIKNGPMGSDNSYGNQGAFEIYGTKGDKSKCILYIIASDGLDWEHVSVHGVYLNSGALFTPSWEQMCKIKELFWDDEDCVIQYHPPKSQYVNVHPNTLHLWRMSNSNLETPPMYLVG